MFNHMYQSLETLRPLCEMHVTLSPFRLFFYALSLELFFMLNLLMESILIDKGSQCGYQLADFTVGRAKSMNQ